MLCPTVYDTPKDSAKRNNSRKDPREPGGSCEDRLVRFHTVSSRTLGPIKRFVGRLDHLFDRGILRARFCHPDADGDRRFSSSSTNGARGSLRPSFAFSPIGTAWIFSPILASKTER